MKATALTAILSFFLNFSFSQNDSGLVARYYFNEGLAVNEISHSPVKTADITFVNDRFGNSHSACFLSGTNFSYLNLGTSPTLKPVAGSFSIWIKMGLEVYAGKGYEVNPIVLTKNHAGDDFFEGYSLVYSLQNKLLSLATTESEWKQIALYSSQPLSLNKWHHVVFSYDDRFLSLYLDGELENRGAKNFRSVFLASDSVMIGNSANSKNQRYFMGTVDDIRIYNRVLSPAEVRALYNEADPNQWHLVVRWTARVFMICVLLGAIVSLFTQKLQRDLENVKQQNRLQNQMYEMEMKVIKAQMNPHFIFNSMNSIQQLILTSDIEKANTYLVKFSRLLRKILESSTEENISVETEIDLLEKYLEIESLRFGHSFHYEIIRDERLSASVCRIPQMLIQPFVENAIWHGLLPKTGKKNISVRFEYIDDKKLRCTIDDNGAGRKKSEPGVSPARNKSMGIPFIAQRLSLMSKEWNNDYNLTIIDKLNNDGSSAGTRVILHLPLLIKTEDATSNHY